MCRRIVKLHENMCKNSYLKLFGNNINLKKKSFNSYFIISIDYLSPCLPLLYLKVRFHKPILRLLCQFIVIYINKSMTFCTLSVPNAKYLVSNYLKLYDIMLNFCKIINTR